MEHIKDNILDILGNKEKYKNTNSLKLLYSCIDLTNLNSFAKESDITELCNKAKNEKYKTIDIPQVAAVCIYPSYISLCKQLLEGNGIDIATVTACFPHSQTFPEVKYLETEMALQHGATEVDIVINISALLNGNKSLVFDEIKTMKQLCGDHHLKVILETDLLKEASIIEEASMMSLEAGADFIKTSTGKDGSTASLEAAYIMCHAIQKHAAATGFKAGFKPAGGISTTDDALSYFSIVKSILGEEWLNSNRFRLGASRLAGNLLEDIVSLD